MFKIIDMISERQAVMMMEDELPPNELKNLRTKHLYGCMQAYASQVSELGQRGELKKFETQLIVAGRLYAEGTKEIKEVMENVYISTLSHVLELKPELLQIAKGSLNASLLGVMRKSQLSNNP